MSRTIFRVGPKRSPNIPPHAPAKMTSKRHAVPFIMDLEIHGSHIDQKDHSTHCEGDNRIPKDTQNNVRPRPHTAHVDKHVLKSLSRSPSVDSSFYDKYERLDRDSVMGDVAYKEKGGVKQKEGVKKKTRPASARVRNSCKHAKSKRRAKSANPSTRLRQQTAPSETTKHSTNTINDKNVRKERPKSAGSLPTRRNTNKGSFLETVMSFDDETKQNTLSNAVRRVSPRSILNKNVNKQTNNISTVKRCLNSKGISRERSVSSRRNSRSDSIGNSSIASTISSISRNSRGDKRLLRRPRSRKSRSRTRRDIAQPTFSDFGSSSKKNSSLRDAIVNEKRITERQKIVAKTINALPNDELVNAPASNGTGSFAYHYNHVRPQSGKKHSAVKKRGLPNTTTLINVVKNANKVQDNIYYGENACIKEFPYIENDMDNSSQRRNVSSSVPRLKMMVAPTATPMASRIRATGAQMLNHSYYGSKRMC